MVSAKGYTMGDRKSESLLTVNDLERPVAIQLFGNDPEIMAKAVENASKKEPEWIDLNMGCPAPKIVNGGNGSALMKNPELAEAVAKAAVNATNLPVTVKMRTGWDNEHINCVEMAKRLEQAGVAAITVHGRTRDQMYAPSVDTESIRQVKKAISIPVIANGDVTDGLSAAKLLEKTDCDAVMIGRGALGRPWVFSQVNAFLNEEAIIPEPPVSERMRLMLKHVTIICNYKGERIGMKEARKHAAWYIKGVRGAAGFRNQIGTLSSMEELAFLAIQVMQADCMEREEKNGEKK